MRILVAHRRQKVAEMAATMTARQIAEGIGETPQTVHNDLRALGIDSLQAKRGKPYSLRSEPKLEREPKLDRERRPRAVKEETASERRARQAEVARAQVVVIRDRLRFKVTPVPTGAPSRVAGPEAAGTKFPTRVQPVGDAPVLKDGAHNVKIGGDVLVGRLRGAKIFTLTLEERATCPKDCALFRACYGNSMQFSTRWQHGPALEAKIEAEVAALCAQHDRILIRLHILGDFYSLAYVAMWARLLIKHRGLHVFGFTAWAEKTQIGAEIDMLRSLYPLRFAVRTSGTCGKWGSFTIDFPTTLNRLGDAVVCPEQRASMSGQGNADHCGACGLCWSGDAAIVFVLH